MDALKALGNHIGVFYPLQIFTLQQVTPFSDTPLFIEGESTIEAELMALAHKLSNRVYQLDSESRQRMPYGSRHACNLSNYLFRMAEEELPSNKDLDLSVYAPLIQRTIDKAFELGPSNTQTGPAIRGDQEIVDKHLELLKKQSPSSRGL